MLIALRPTKDAAVFGDDAVDHGGGDPPLGPLRHTPGERPASSSAATEFTGELAGGASGIGRRVSLGKEAGRRVRAKTIVPIKGGPRVRIPFLQRRVRSEPGRCRFSTLSSRRGVARGLFPSCVLLDASFAGRNAPCRNLRPLTGDSARQPQGGAARGLAEAVEGATWRWRNSARQSVRCLAPKTRARGSARRQARHKARVEPLARRLGQSAAIAQQVGRGSRGPVGSASRRRRSVLRRYHPGL